MADGIVCLNCGCELPKSAADALCPQCRLSAAQPPAALDLPPGAFTDESTFIPQHPVGSSNVARPTKGVPSVDPGAETLPPHERTRGASDLPATGSHLRYFGDYILLDEVARGGMGVVFRARQLSLNRTVALKMILAGQFAGEEDVRRFYSEAESAANLDHPGIVPIFEVGQHEGQHFYSMGFVDGPSLAAKLGAGPLPPHQAAALLLQVVRAVQYAHEQHVIHRDLKPANILLDKAGLPRITDFGLAKSLKRDSKLTGTGQILGTPSYMPPEQAGGKSSEIGPGADVYALGAILYHMLTGRPPFEGPDPMIVLVQVLAREPDPPRKRNSAIPRDLNTICLKCLEKDPARRYPSAQELSDDLQRFLDHEPIVARPPGPVGRLWRWSKRRPVASGCAASFVGLVFLAAGIASAVMSVASFGSIGFQFFKDRSTPAATFPVTLGMQQTTPVFPVQAGTLCELELKMRIRSTSFEVDDSSFALPASKTDNDDTQDKKPSIRAHYNFRVTYAVFDENGMQVDAGTSRAVWNSATHRHEGEAMDRDMKTARAIPFSTIGQFHAPASGKVKVQLEIEPDQVYHAEAESIELRVHENIRDDKGLTIAGGAFCCTTPLLLVAGVALLVCGPIVMSRAKAKAPGANL